MLDPDVVLRSEGGIPGIPSREKVEGVGDVVSRILERGAPFAPYGRPAFVNGKPGAVVVMPNGQVRSVVTFTVADERITAIDLVVDPAGLSRVRI